MERKLWEISLLQYLSFLDWAFAGVEESEAFFAFANLDGSSIISMIEASLGIQTPMPRVETSHLHAKFPGSSQDFRRKRAISCDAKSIAGPPSKHPFKRGNDNYWSSPNDRFAA
jgi:hypothetical protein